MKSSFAFYYDPVNNVSDKMCLLIKHCCRSECQAIARAQARLLLPACDALLLRSKCTRSKAKHTLMPVKAHNTVYKIQHLCLIFFGETRYRRIPKHNKKYNIKFVIIDLKY